MIPADTSRDGSMVRLRMLDSLNGDERLDQNYIEHWVRELQLDRSVLSKRLANQTRRASNDEAWVGGKLEYNRRA